MIAPQLLFHHTCSIKRETHVKSSQRKQFAQTTVSTLVNCRIQPAGDVQSVSVLGAGVRDTFHGYFPTGTDIQEQDEVTWTQGSEVLIVTSVQKFYGLINDHETHIEVLMERRQT